MSNQKIFLLGKSDAPELAALEQACFPSAWNAEQYAAALQERVALDGPPFSQSVCNTFAGRELPVAGLYTDGLSAYLSMRVLGSEAEVYNVAVRPELRGRGLATTLMETVLALARCAGILTVFLEVRASNVPALALYSRMGFRASGLRKAYYPDGENAVQMLCLLDKKTE